MRKRLIIATLVFCLIAVLFMGITNSASTRPYDAWVDYDENGYVGAYDLAQLVSHYGASGDPTKNVTVTNPIPGITIPYYYIYSAPFIVSAAIPPHPSPYGVGPGVYETDVLVHNPSGIYNVNITKKISIAVNDTYSVVRTIMSVLLYPDWSIRIDSAEIWYWITVYMPGYAYDVVKGYVSIISLSPYLDVNAYYTVSEVKTNPIPPPTLVPGNTTSIDSQIISPKPYSPVLIP